MNQSPCSNQAGPSTPGFGGHNGGSPEWRTKSGWRGRAASGACSRSGWLREGPRRCSRARRSETASSLPTPVSSPRSALLAVSDDPPRANGADELEPGEDPNEGFRLAPSWAAPLRRWSLCRGPRPARPFTGPATPNPAPSISSSIPTSRPSSAYGKSDSSGATDSGKPSGIPPSSLTLIADSSNPVSPGSWVRSAAISSWSLSRARHTTPPLNQPSFALALDLGLRRGTDPCRSA